MSLITVQPPVGKFVVDQPSNPSFNRDSARNPNTNKKSTKTSVIFFVIVNNLLGWLEENILDYKEIEVLYTTYYNTKDDTPLKKELFKLVKPLEELATYLSKIAEINKESENELTDQLFYIKLYTLYLLYLWFEVDCKETYYFKDIYKFNFTEELRKINCLGLKNIDTLEDKINIRMIIDKSKHISTFLTNYSYKIAVKPRGVYKNRDKRRKK